MSTQIDTAVKRGRGYWFVDGFIEIFGGGILLLLGGIVLLGSLTPQDSFLAQFLSIAGQVALVKLVGFFLVILLLWWLKDHFTYPRTGFIRGKRMPLTQIYVFLRNSFLILALPALGLIAAIVLLPPLRGAIFSMSVWFPVGLGVVWAALCTWLGEWAGVRRFWVVAALIFLAGIKAGAWQFIVGVANLTLETAIYRTFASVGLLTLASGMVFLLSGLATFLRYRKENPLPYQEEA
jgi:hypothetical protein